MDILLKIFCDNWKWFFTATGYVLAFLIINGRWRKEKFLEGWRRQSLELVSIIKSICVKIDEFTELVKSEGHDRERASSMILEITKIYNDLSAQSLVDRYIDLDVLGGVRTCFIINANYAKELKEHEHMERLATFTILNQIICINQKIIKNISKAEGWYSSTWPFFLTRNILHWYWRESIRNWAKEKNFYDRSHHTKNK